MTDALLQLVCSGLVLAAGSFLIAFVIGAGYSLGAALGRAATRPVEDDAPGEDMDISLDHTHGE